MRLDMKQGSKEWKEMRNRCITGTDASVIMGVNPFMNKTTLLKKKLNLIPEHDNDAMKEGRRLEPIAREVYENNTGNLTINPPYLHDQESWAMCSPDGVTFDGKIVVEIKCGKKVWEQAKQDVVPEYYYAQIQHNIWVTGAEIAHYFVYFNNDHKLILVDKNEEFIEKMALKERDFYFNELLVATPESLEIQIKKDEEFAYWAEAYKQVDEFIESSSVKKDSIRQKLIDLCDGKSSMGYGIKVNKMMREGSIAYKEIPELAKLDLSKYRKPPTEVWSITRSKE